MTSPRSLRTQMALTFGCLVAFVVVLMSLALGEWSRVHLQQQAGDSLHLVARNAGRLLASGLDERVRLVGVLAQSDDLWKNGVGSVEVKALLSRMQLTQPHHQWIGVASLQGRVKAATGDMLMGQDVSSRPWFTQGLQDVYVGDVHPAKLLSGLLPPSQSGEPLRFVDFAAPIVRNGQTLGVLAIHGSWDWTRDVIESLIPELEQEVKTEVFLFDKQGTLIYGPGGRLAPFDVLGQNMPEMPRQTESEMKGSAQTVIWRDQPSPFLTTWTPLPALHPAADLGWQIVVRKPVAEAYADARQAMWMMLFVGLILALGAVGIATWLARRIGTDLRTLSQAARQINDGNDGVSIPLVHSTSDVHSLSQALASMTQRLVNANAFMEQQVAQRTQELRQANQELDRQASTDPLTGLLNRRGFHTQMEFALALARRSARPLAMLMLDIDYFKRVNDTYGHDVGDRVLQSLASVLRLRLRESDLIARLGGEEFVVVLPDTPLDAALQTAEAVRIMVAEHPMEVVGQITVSIGLSMMHLDTAEAASITEVEADLLHRSDEALYRAKSQGRNQVCISNTL